MGPQQFEFYQEGVLFRHLYITVRSIFQPLPSLVMSDPNGLKLHKNNL